VIKELKKLPQNIQDKIIAPTLRDASRGDATVANQTISRTYNVKSSDVRKSTNSFAKRVGTTLQGLIVSKSDKRTQNLVNFIKNRAALTRNKISKSG